ncbi:transposase [Gluconobacter wancherniae]|nr:transposase [Gluconobacter wancherniae]
MQQSEEERLSQLSGLDDQPEAFSWTVNFVVFRPGLKQAPAYSYWGGRPLFNPVLMIKNLIIQMLNSLADERTEYLINNYLSIMLFLNLVLTDRIPDTTKVVLDGFNIIDGYLPALGRSWTPHS